jgi:hypothetical protein
MSLLSEEDMMLRTSPEIEKYIAEKNQFRFVFKQKTLPSPPTKACADELAKLLQSDMSPENLAQDGELSQYQVNIRARFLNKVADDLRSMFGVTVNG